MSFPRAVDCWGQAQGVYFKVDTLCLVTLMGCRGQTTAFLALRFPVLLVVLRDSWLSFRQLDAKVFGQAAASVDVVVNCAVTRYSPVMSKLRPSDPSSCNFNMQKVLESFGSVRTALPSHLLPELKRISALRSLFVFVRSEVHQKLAAQPGR